LDEQSGVWLRLSEHTLASVVNETDEVSEMTEIRVIALPTETAKKVLETKSSPGYGHPAHTEVARGAWTLPTLPSSFPNR